jgi:hypothetical protein
MSNHRTIIHHGKKKKKKRGDKTNKSLNSDYYEMKGIAKLNVHRKHSLFTPHHPKR